MYVTPRFGLHIADPGFLGSGCLVSEELPFFLPKESQAFVSRSPIADDGRGTCQGMEGWK